MNYFKQFFYISRYYIQNIQTFLFSKLIYIICEKLSNGRPEKVSREEVIDEDDYFDEITDIMNDDEEEDEEEVCPFWRIIYLNLSA